MYFAVALFSKSDIYLALSTLLAKKALIMAVSILLILIELNFLRLWITNLKAFFCKVFETSWFNGVQKLKGLCCNNKFKVRCTIVD